MPKLRFPSRMIGSNERYSLAYIRDGAGNPLQVSYSGFSFHEPYTGSSVVKYEYDPAGRLTGEDWGPGHVTTWGYDWAGNRDPSSNTYNEVDEMNPGSGCLYDKLGNLQYQPDSSTYPRTRC